jgi:hypothetical protein
MGGAGICADVKNHRIGFGADFSASFQEIFFAFQGRHERVEPLEQGASDCRWHREGTHGDFGNGVPCVLIITLLGGYTRSGCAEVERQEIPTKAAADHRLAGGARHVDSF